MLLVVASTFATCPPADGVGIEPVWADGVPTTDCEQGQARRLKNDLGLVLWRAGNWLALEEPALGRHAWLGEVPEGALRFDEHLRYLDARAGNNATSLRLPDDRDFDGDGKPDTLTSEGSGGSGGGVGLKCVTLSGPSHTACREVEYSTYSLIFTTRVTQLDPPVGNQAVAVLRPNCPAVLDASRPEFGSIRARRSATAWFPGRPRQQRSACLELEAKPEAWNRVYANRWKGSRTPREVARSDAWVVFQHAHALAVYDIARDRHRWLVNLDEKVGGGHKVDRWPIIQHVSIEGNALRVHYGNALEEERKTLELSVE